MPEKPKEEQTKVDTSNEEAKKKEEDDEKPPVGNGGQTDRYVWTQTLEELIMRIPVDSDVKGKNC